VKDIKIPLKDIRSDFNLKSTYFSVEDAGETLIFKGKGFGHGITKPKERLAAIWHNYQWFGKYIFNENIDIPTE
jgi:hypothetical protein